MAWLAQELFTFEADNNSSNFRIVTAAVAAENGVTASDLLEQLATFNVLCQRHSEQGHTAPLQWVDDRSSHCADLEGDEWRRPHTGGT